MKDNALYLYYNGGTIMLYAEQTMSSSYLPEGELFYSKANREFLSCEIMLRRAMEQSCILEANAVLCDKSFDLTVDLGCMKGYIPRAEAAYSPDGSTVRDIAVITRVGRPVCFKIIGFEERDGELCAILSRKEAQKEYCQNHLSALTPGDIIDARVTHLEQFGAFCDIGCGVISLLPVDAISVSRISHPRDRLKSGMKIRAVVKSVDKESGRICLSHRELLGTWEENSNQFSASQTITGIVRGVEDYGIFIELAPNLAGLAEYRDDIAVGQTVSVYIKSIIPDRMKIKLAIIDLCPAASMQNKFNYFIEPDVTHIDYWRYSPCTSDKIIESRFTE